MPLTEILSAQGFCWMGYACLMLEDNAFIFLDASGAELSYCGALCSWDKGGSVALICRNVAGDFLGISRGKKGLWACLKVGRS